MAGAAFARTNALPMNARRPITAAKSDNQLSICLPSLPGCSVYVLSVPLSRTKEELASAAKYRAEKSRGETRPGCSGL
jgi:hypothetical protein